MTWAGPLRMAGLVARNRMLALFLIAGVPVTALAAEFPLEFRKVAPQDVTVFAKGNGTYYMLSSRRPAKITKEPRPRSSGALYGEVVGNSRALGVALRLDESQGQGKGYDQIIVDVNRNGDLTDDPFAGLAPTQARPTPQGFQYRLFGPLELPPEKAVAGGRPVYFVEAYLPESSVFSQRSVMSSGHLRLIAAWYLETTIDLDGVKKKVGVCDSDASFRIGDFPEFRTYSSRGSRWYWQFGDLFLVDANDDGKFSTNPLESESAPFGPLIYLGAKPINVSLASRGDALQVTPAEDLIEVQLQPRGSDVYYLTLAWARAQGAGWKLIRPNARDGKIVVPAGKYRLINCALAGGEGSGQIMAIGQQNEAKAPFEFGPGQPNVLRCGGPLTIKVAAERSMQPVSLLRAEAVPDAAYTLSINAQVLGADGEVYSTYGRGERFAADAPKPAFKVVDAAGKTLVSGNLEFG